MIWVMLRQHCSGQTPLVLRVSVNGFLTLPWTAEAHSFLGAPAGPSAWNALSQTSI